MFPTQLNNTKTSKQNTIQNDKVEINFKLLETFYQGLIDEIVRPKIENFLDLKPGVDVKQKFDRYEKLIRTKNADYEEIQKSQDEQQVKQNQKKNIVFRIPHDIAQSDENKIIGSVQGSSIKYFRISDSMKSSISNLNLFAKSLQLKKSEKEHIQKFRQFLYDEESIFFLLKGNIDINRKFEQNKDKSKADDRRKKQISIFDKGTYSNLQSSSENIQQSVSFRPNESYPVQDQGTNNILHNKLNQYHQKSNKQWKKHLEVKELTFFSLINFKSLSNSKQPEYFKFVPKSPCLIAKILINQRFGLQYLKKQLKKYNLLSTLLSSSNKTENQKPGSFRTLMDLFEEENIRRDMVISFEGKKNQKIYVVSDEGQLQVSKKAFFKHNHNVEGSKNLKICTIKGRTILNAEWFLSQSRNVINIFQSNSFLKESQRLQLQKLETSDEQPHTNSKKQKPSNNKNQNHLQQIQELQNALFQKKRQENRVYASMDPNEKINLGKDEKAYFQFYLPQRNCSNFTIKADTAFVTVYSIDFSTFQNVASQRIKKKLTKSYEQSYITLLRKSMEKLDLFEKQVQVSALKKSISLQEYAALTSVQQLNRQSPELKNQQQIEVSAAKINFQNKKQLKGLKRNDLLFREGQILEKKMEMINRKSPQKKNKKVVTQTFKAKIQNLIVKNLKDINNLSSQRHNESGHKASILTDLNNFYAGNVVHIVQTERSNNEKYHMVMDEKQSVLQQKKSKQLKQSIQIISQELYVDPSIYDPKRNKQMKISLMRKGHPDVKQNNNFLRGVTMDSYADAMKSKVVVRINQTNKIKEQFMKIQSKCESCKCYDDLDSYRHISSHNTSRTLTEQRHSTHDVKFHTMKIGVNQKTSSSNFNKVEYRTAYDEKSMGRKLNQAVQDNEPFEKMYNRIKVLKQRSAEKFNFNEHLLRKGKNLKSRKERKKSLPLLI